MIQYSVNPTQDVARIPTSCLRLQEASRSSETEDSGVRGRQGLLLAVGALFRALSKKTTRDL